MNSKIMAAGAVVALCAVALIGVGYAYTATVTSAGNDIGAEYIMIQVGGNAEKVWTSAEVIQYDTETKSDKVEYTPIANTQVSQVIVLSKDEDAFISSSYDEFSSVFLHFSNHKSTI